MIFNNVSSALVIFLFSVIGGIYSASKYNIGTLQDPGPGLMPIGLFTILALLSGSELTTKENLDKRIVWPAFVVGASIISFYVFYIIAGLYVSVTSTLLVVMLLNNGQGIFEKIKIVAVINFLVFVFFVLILGKPL